MGGTDVEDDGAESEDIGSHPDPRDTIGEIIARRYPRRALLAAGAALLTAGSVRAQPAPGAHSSGNSPDGALSTLRFPELRHQIAAGDAVYMPANTTGVWEVFETVRKTWILLP